MESSTNDNMLGSKLDIIKQSYVRPTINYKNSYKIFLLIGQDHFIFDVIIHLNNNFSNTKFKHASEKWINRLNIAQHLLGYYEFTFTSEHVKFVQKTNHLSLSRV